MVQLCMRVLYTCSLGMDHTFWNPLTVKVSHLFNVHIVLGRVKEGKGRERERERVSKIVRALEKITIIG